MKLGVYFNLFLKTLWVLSLSAATLSVSAGTKEGIEAFEQKNYLKAFQELKIPAQQHDWEAQFYIGMTYLSLTPPNYEQAASWFEAIEVLDKAEIYGNLAFIYSHRKNPNKNMTKAVAYWEKAANHKTPLASAQYNLALIYLEGKYKPKNTRTSFIWLERAAENGSREAQYNLGIRYAQGVNGASLNPKKARYYLTQAAYQGLPEAQYEAAHYMLNAIGGEKDTPGAIHCLEQLARQGNEAAAFQLGVIYTGGKEVPVDKRQAFKWLTLLLLNQESFDAQELLIQLSKGMSAEEKKEAYWQIQKEFLNQK